MPELVVVVPSRNRPQAAHELVDAFHDTCADSVTLLFVIDGRDVAGIYDYPHVSTGNVDVGTCWTESTSMVEALNLAAASILVGEKGFWSEPSPPFAIGFMGDDHRPRTHGWDRAYVDALRDLGTGIVYGDDLLQRGNLPTQCAMTSDIVRTLGFMAPPTLTHLYVDNFWLALGRRAECIKYLSDVVVEHLHPVAGKAQWDEGYARVNSSGMYTRDEAAYREYCVTGLAADVEKVRTLRTGVPAQ